MTAPLSLELDFARDWGPDRFPVYYRMCAELGVTPFPDAEDATGRSAWTLATWRAAVGQVATGRTARRMPE